MGMGQDCKSLDYDDYDRPNNGNAWLYDDCDRRGVRGAINREICVRQVAASLRVLPVTAISVLGWC